VHGDRGLVELDECGVLERLDDLLVVDGDQFEPVAVLDVPDRLGTRGRLGTSPHVL
jgi:hypothetical protein